MSAETMRTRRQWLGAFLIVLGCLGVTARGACPIWDDYRNAREELDKAAKKLNAKEIKIPPELEAKLNRLTFMQMDVTGLDWQGAMQSARKYLTDDERKQVAPYFEARAARDKAEQALKQAEQAYIQEMNKKDAALKAAQADFEKEQAWLEAEKKAIGPMPRDDAYLDRVSQITKRLKAAYLKMQGALAPFTECFPDARVFVEDKDERISRIDALDAEIARRRGQKPADPAITADPGGKPAGPDAGKADPGAPGPLGATYVLDGAPEIAPKRGKITSVDATGFTFEAVVNGKKLKAGVKIDKAPPAKLRINERVELVMTASGDPGAWVDAKWGTDNVAGQIPDDNECSNIPTYKGGVAGRNPSVATSRFYFGSGDDKASIAMWGGQYNNSDGTDVKVVWKYRKVN